MLCWGVSVSAPFNFELIDIMIRSCICAGRVIWGMIALRESKLYAVVENWDDGYRECGREKLD